MALENGGRVSVRSLLLFLIPKSLVPIWILDIYHYYPVTPQSIAQVLLTKLHCPHCFSYDTMIPK